MAKRRIYKVKQILELGNCKLQASGAACLEHPRLFYGAHEIEDPPVVLADESPAIFAEVVQKHLLLFSCFFRTSGRATKGCPWRRCNLILPLGGM